MDAKFVVCSPCEVRGKNVAEIFFLCGFGNACGAKVPCGWLQGMRIIDTHDVTFCKFE